MRVLIVDDEADARFLLAAFLEPFQCEIVEAEDCQAGLEILQSQPIFDLALVDWRTPRMSGVDFVRCVRKDEKLKNLPIIMTTGLNDMESINEALDSGVSEYAMKPFTEDMILDRIKMLGLPLTYS